jgi:hypothetical protein
MRIEALDKYRNRNPNGYFTDLPWTAQQRAYQLLAKYCERWRGAPRPWRFPILVGRVAFWAQHTFTSERGRSMAAKKGGYAVQRMYRAEGRTGERHPAHKAAAVSSQVRRARKALKAKAEADRKAGITARDRAADAIMAQWARLQGI